MEFVGVALALEEVPCQTSIRSILQQLHSKGRGGKGWVEKGRGGGR